MFRWLRGLLQRQAPQKLFDGPVMPIPRPPAPKWVRSVSPDRRFASPAEAHCYAAALEHAHLMYREQSGQLAAEAEAEMRENLGVSLANERPR